jgi:protein-tyrosine phosphatase
MNDKPIPESYWVLPGNFLAGGYPISSIDETVARQCLAAFIDAGINSFFDLTRAGELPPYLSILQEEAIHYGVPINYQRVTIQDKGLPAHEQMAALLVTLDAALEAGQKIYLHCWGGIGRTGTVVGCWLVRHGLTGGQALIRLNELYRTSEQSHIFPRSPETDAQVNFILGWVEDGLA